MWIFVLSVFLCIIESTRIALSFLRTTNFIQELRKRYDLKIQAIKEQNKIEARA